jgi:hypothetical protein
VDILRRRFRPVPGIDARREEFLQFMLLLIAGRLQRQRSAAIEYLQAKNRLRC